jgi:hypothetical protein
MIVSKYGRRLLLSKIKTFYSKLSDEEKKNFMNPRLCFRKEVFSFYKFVYFFWLNKYKKRKTGHSAALLENVGLTPNVSRGANVIVAREKILKACGIDFTNILYDKPKKTPIKNSTQIVFVRDSRVYKYLPLDTNIPMILPENSDFALDHAIIVLEGYRITNGVRRGLSHALSCVRLPNDDFKIIDPTGLKLTCDWRNPKNFAKIFKADWPFHSYGSTFGYDDWGYNSITYVRKNQPTFNLSTTTTNKPAQSANLGVNNKGRKILQGPRGGKFVLLGRSKRYI